MAQQPSRLVILLVLLGASAVAVALARPEHIPDTAPPPRSEASRAVSTVAAASPSAGEPAEALVGESAGAEADAPEEAAPGYAMTRGDLETGLLKLRSRVVACGDPATPPMVRVKLTILPNGAVSSVSVPPELKGTNAADCLVRALRTASFPAWSAPPLPSIEWSYPVRFDGGD